MANTAHKNASTALAAAQSEIGRAVKDSQNPHFKSKYADLASVMDACMEALNAQGIAVLQPVETGEFGSVVKTILAHGESETQLECTVPLILGKNDMQGFGSAVTYARRYGLMCMAGVAPDDDDGNAAVASAPKKNTAQTALNDAWRDGVLDAIPDGATPEQKAKAFADAIIADFEGKGEKALQNSWAKRAGMIAEFESRYPALYEDVLDAFSTRMADFAKEEA